MRPPALLALALVLILLTHAYADTYASTTLVATQENPYTHQILAEAIYTDDQDAEYDHQAYETHYVNKQDTEHDQQPVAQTTYTDTQEAPEIHVDVNIEPTTDGKYKISWHVWIEGVFSGHNYHILVYRDDTGETLYEKITNEATRSITVDTPHVTILVHYGGFDIGPKVPPEHFFIFRSNLLPMVVKKSGSYRFTMIGYTTSDVHLELDQRTYAIVAQSGGGLMIKVQEVN